MRKCLVDYIYFDLQTAIEKTNERYKQLTKLDKPVIFHHRGQN